MTATRKLTSCFYSATLSYSTHSFIHLDLSTCRHLFSEYAFLRHNCCPLAFDRHGLSDKNVGLSFLEARLQAYSLTYSVAANNRNVWHAQKLSSMRGMAAMGMLDALLIMTIVRDQVSFERIVCASETKVGGSVYLLCLGSRHIEDCEGLERR